MPAFQIFIDLILRLDGLLCLTGGVPEPLGDVKLLGKLKETKKKTCQDSEHPEISYIMLYISGYIKKAKLHKQTIREESVSLCSSR